MATHPNILAWRIPWTEESGRLQSMGLQRVGNDWAHKQTSNNCVRGTVNRKGGEGNGEPGRLQSMGSLSRTRLSNFTFTFHFHALEKETTTHLCSCLENSRDGGAWWAAVYGVTQSRTRLKRLSSSSSKQEKRPKGITHHSIFLVIFNIIP